MKTQILNKEDRVIHYYSTLESRAIYFVLKGVKHFGYYPKGRENISVSEAQKLIIERIFKKLNLQNESFLLDAGCGEGEAALYLANKYNVRVNGIDILDFNIEKAIKKMMRLGLDNKVEFKVMDYTNLDFGDETFDGVYTMETLVHAPDYRWTLGEFYRVLKPNGKIILLEYTLAPLDTFPPDLKKIREMIIEESGMYSLPYFLHGRFPEILKDAGFVNISVENATPRTIPLFKKAHFFFYLPYRIINLLGLQKKFVNITSAVEAYENFIPKDLWRENIVTAMKK